MKILAIDDNRDNLTTLKAILHDAFPDGDVLTAQNGPKGIELVMTEDPDVILLDIVMPGMDGFEACRRLKQDDATKHIPVVFLTALKTDRKSRIQALDTGADAFLAKPIDEVELIAQIRAMTRIKAAHVREQTEKDRLAALVTARTQQLVKQLNERMEAEKELIIKEKSIESSHSAIGLADLDGNVTYVNPAFLEMWGYESKEEVLGKPSVSFWMAEERAQDVADASLRKGSWKGELLAKRKNGSTFTALVSANLVYDAQGKPLHKMASFIDITERKQAEEALRESEETARALMNATMDAAFMVDLSGTILTANEEMARRFDCTKADMIGASIWDVLPSDVAENRKAMVAEVVRTGKMVRCEDQRGGRFIHNSIHPVFDANGKVTRIAVFARDITEQKEAEANLREREAWLRAASESRLDSFFIFKAERDDAGEIIDFVFVYLNKTAEEMLQMPRESLLGKGMCEVLPINREAGFFEKYKKVLETGIPLEEEFLLPNTHVPSAWYYHQVLPLPDGIAILHRDITDRKQAEEEREKLQAQLMQAQKMESVGRLAGGVAHDFNNMLQPILGYADLALMKMDKDHPVYTDIEEIRKTAKRSGNIIRQLLAFARKQVIAPVVLDLNDQVGGMLKMLRRLIGEDINLAWLPGADVWEVRMDPSQIDQILVNLVVNARDAIRDVGQVSIETENVALDEAYCAEHPESVPGPYVRLSVSDTGDGMDTETLHNIFDPFFTTKEAGKGTGLGLATVYGIVKQNKGYIEVQSEPGKGASFHIYLPWHEVQPKEVEAAEAVSAGSARGTETVLLVEDGLSVLESSRRMLTALGYTVLPAATPEEAMRQSETYSGDIHLLLTDVVMPGMNGRDLADRIRQTRPAIRSLYMSGYTADIIARQGVLEKGVQFIQKPFSLDQLARKVREAIGQ